MTFPGHATIADSDGSVVAQMLDAEGVLTATVTLDPSRKRSAQPQTFGRFVYPAGPAGLLTLIPAWLCGHMYAHSPERRRRARTVSGVRTLRSQMDTLVGAGPTDGASPPCHLVLDERL